MLPPMRTLTLMVLLTLAPMLQAAPAYYWQWRSKLDGTITCSPVPLGPGWTRIDGPFRDGRCEKPVLAK